MIEINKKYHASEWESRIKNAIKQTNNMTQAYKLLGLERKTFKKMAEELGLYKPNQGNKGGVKNIQQKILTEDILNNKKEFQSHKLKLRLLKEGYFERKCYHCGNTKWMGKEIPLELHHKNGKHNDNSLDNLTLLCPNCHALTNTYRSKNLNNN